MAIYTGKLFDGQEGEFYCLLEQGRILADILGIAFALSRVAGIRMGKERNYTKSTGPYWG